MELVICQKCGSLLRSRRRDCSDCGEMLSKFSPTKLLPLKAGGPTEKCIPAPPNDHLLLERVVTYRTTDRLSETSPCRRGICKHAVDGKRDDEGAGSVVTSRSFTFGAALDGNVVSARAEEKISDRCSREDKEPQRESGDTDYSSSRDLENLENEQPHRGLIDQEGSISELIPSEHDTENGDMAQADELPGEENVHRSSKKRLAKNAATLEPGGQGRSDSDAGMDEIGEGAKVLSQKKKGRDTERSSLKFQGDGPQGKPPLKTVLMAAGVGVFVIVVGLFTFMKPNPSQQASTSNVSNSASFPLPPASEADPAPSGYKPPEIAGNWKVFVAFPSPNGQEQQTEFVAAVRQQHTAIAGQGADANGTFQITGTITPGQQHTIEFQKSYGNGTDQPMAINFRGDIVDDIEKIASGPCVMRIARGGSILHRARSDMLQGSWMAQRTTQDAAAAVSGSQSSGLNVTAILGVLLAVGISAFMFIKHKGAQDKSASGKLGDDSSQPPKSPKSSKSEKPPKGGRDR